MGKGVSVGNGVGVEEGKGVSVWVGVGVVVGGGVGVAVRVGAVDAVGVANAGTTVTVLVIARVTLVEITSFCSAQPTTEKRKSRNPAINQGVKEEFVCLGGMAFTLIKGQSWLHQRIKDTTDFRG